MSLLPYIINLSNTDELVKDVSYNQEYYWVGGYGALVTPNSVWYNGATYITGTLDADANNAPVIFKWKNDVLEYNGSVGTIDNADILEHSHPAILIIDGYIYIFQVNGHNEDIKIWKSDTQEDISSFTLHHTITGDFSYCNPKLLTDGRVVILNRNGWSDFEQIFQISDVDDYTTWTNRTATASDFLANDVRHYPSHPYMYGSNTWHYFGISLRDENTTPNGIATYFGQAIYKTQDFETFYSLDEVFSKNIVSSGGLTRSEIETNLMVVGSNTAQTTYVMPLQFIVIDDVVYSRYYDNAASYFKFMKIATDGTITTYDCDIPNVSTTINFGYKIFIWYNGNNLVITTDKDIYVSDLNFSNVQFYNQYAYSGETDAVQVVSLPYNLDEVINNYLLGGTTTEGVFPYFITSDKFLL